MLNCKGQVMWLKIICSISPFVFAINLVAQDTPSGKEDTFSKGTLVAELDYIPSNHSRMILEDGRSKVFKGHQTGSVGVEFFTSESKSFAVLGSLTTNSPLLIGNPECEDSICENVFVYSASLLRKIYWRHFSLGYGLNYSEFNYTKSEWSNSGNRILIGRTELTRVSWGTVLSVDYSTALEKLFDTKDLHLGLGITFRPTVYLSPKWILNYQHSASLDLKVRWIINY